MDFFKPVQSSDPLVRRPVVKPAPAPIPKTRITSAPPSLKPSPNVEKETYRYAVSKPAIHSTVVRETVVKTVVSTPDPVKKSTPAPTVQKPKAPVEQKKTEKEFDDWFDSLEAEGFFDEKPKEKKGPSYPFGGESPFLKSVQVEKRPLSGSTKKEQKPNSETFQTYQPKPVKVVPKRKKKDKIALLLIIFGTVILGVAAGIGVFFLISK